MICVQLQVKEILWHHIFTSFKYYRDGPVEQKGWGRTFWRFVLNADFIKEGLSGPDEGQPIELKST